MKKSNIFLFAVAIVFAVISAKFLYFFMDGINPNFDICAALFFALVSLGMFMQAASKHE